MGRTARWSRSAGTALAAAGAALVLSAALSETLVLVELSGPREVAGSCQAPSYLVRAGLFTASYDASCAPDGSPFRLLPTRRTPVTELAVLVPAQSSLGGIVEGVTFESCESFYAPGGVSESALTELVLGAAEAGYGASYTKLERAAQGVVAAIPASVRGLLASKVTDNNSRTSVKGVIDALAASSRTLSEGLTAIWSLPSSIPDAVAASPGVLGTTWAAPLSGVLPVDQLSTDLRRLYGLFGVGKLALYGGVNAILQLSSPDPAVSGFSTDGLGVLGLVGRGYAAKDALARWFDTAAYNYSVAERAELSAAGETAVSQLKSALLAHVRAGLVSNATLVSALPSLIFGGAQLVNTTSASSSFAPVKAAVSALGAAATAQGARVAGGAPGSTASALVAAKAVLDVCTKSTVGACNDPANIDVQVPARLNSTAANPACLLVTAYLAGLPGLAGLGELRAADCSFLQLLRTLGDSKVLPVVLAELARSGQESPLAALGNGAGASPPAAAVAALGGVLTYVFDMCATKGRGLADCAEVVTDPHALGLSTISKPEQSRIPDDAGATGYALCTALLLSGGACGDGSRADSTFVNFLIWLASPAAGGSVQAAASSAALLAVYDACRPSASKSACIGSMAAGYRPAASSQLAAVAFAALQVPTESAAARVANCKRGDEDIAHFKTAQRLVIAALVAMLLAALLGAATTLEGRAALARVASAAAMLGAALAVAALLVLKSAPVYAELASTSAPAPRAGAAPVYIEGSGKALILAGTACAALAGLALLASARTALDAASAPAKGVESASNSSQLLPAF
jgi:hypothetical protein